MAALYICLYTTVLSEWHFSFGYSIGESMLDIRRSMDPDSKCLHTLLAQHFGGHH
jgi:hypothetical protein